MKDVFIHPQAIVEDGASIGLGTRVWAFAHVMNGVKIGAQCNIAGHTFLESGAVVGDQCTIKNGVSIWNGVTIGDRVFLGPNCVFTNVSVPRIGYKRSSGDFERTVVHSDVTIGANATILCGITIDHHSFIGAGATLTKSTEPHGLYVGNPARKVGVVCRCGFRLNKSLHCDHCAKSFSESELLGEENP